MFNSKNITFQEKEDFCRWKGELTTEEYVLKTFGKFCDTDYLFIVEGSFIVIGESFFVDQNGADIDGMFFKTIEKVYPISKLKHTNVRLFAEFLSDLCAYYEEMHGGLRDAAQRNMIPEQSNYYTLFQSTGHE